MKVDWDLIVLATFLIVLFVGMFAHSGGHEGAFMRACKEACEPSGVVSASHEADSCECRP